MATLSLKASRNEQHSVCTFDFGDCGPTRAGSVIAPIQSTLGPSDYHLFGPMKKMLGGQKIASDSEVQSTVRQWLRQQPVLFFASGIQKLVDRWDKCLNEFGRYV